MFGNIIAKSDKRNTDFRFRSLMYLSLALAFFRRNKIKRKNIIENITTMKG